MISETVGLTYVLSGIARMIPFNILVELFGIATEPWGMHPWYHVEPPTPQSIQRIQQELCITIPDDYTRLAKACPSYGGWLAGLGEDYDHGCHILRLNAAFHTCDDSPSLPQHLVLLNHGYDGDCDCWDKRELTKCGEHPIVYVGLGGVRPSRVIRFETFRDYIEAFALRNAPDNPKPGLRRKAKRLIQGFEHGDRAA